ncbi:GRAM domain-containing protein 2A isoform X3 [Salmo salar]|uniref:GRAM domain-containing protein 2A isoform X3 n=1 Tax=Salmo salar TaxID=8030 RepID=A0A1S3R565_SALSA|nr:GRAM domain-containing protein 2A-like isoform X3 [Salmo salar]|eukprot:XP_014047276.1 PREDICTED: GRAM domain-containing protein 2-like isoform X2 [Salmo salar]
MNMKHRRFSLDSSVSLEDGDGGSLLDQRRGSRSRPKKSGERKRHSLEEAQLEIQELGCSLNRSNSLRSQTIEEESFHRPDGVIITKHSFVKYNKAFHKLFKDIPAEEKLTHAFTCALQKEVLYHGKLFVSVNYVCFYSSVLLKDTKVVVHVSSIKEVKKQNSALSMLSIHTTDGDKYLLVSLRNRQVCYKILQSVCTQAQQGEQGENGNSSSHASPGENGVDDVNQDIDTISSHSSLEDSMEQSLPKETVYSDLPSRGRDSYTPRSSISKDQDDQFTFTEEEDSANSCFWRVTERIKSLLLIREMSNLNILLSIYLFLVVFLLLSSGYIGLRILALEEQLSSLGALPEFSIHHREYRYKET